MSYLDRLASFACPDLSAYLTLRVAGHAVGSLKPDFARHLADFPQVFQVGERDVVLSPRFRGYDDRTRAVEEVLQTLHNQRVVPDWRRERYRICTAFSEPPLLAIDRGSAPLMGIRSYGVHLNGFVRAEGGLKMWIGRRAKDRGIAPGKLDQIVAGGQPAGLTVAENLVKECAEEASIPPELAARAKPVGALFYTCERPEGLRRDVLFIYDLELPAGFVPNNADGEMESFELLSLPEVAAIARDTDDFKFNCALVAIDFLMRHGFLAPDEPDYDRLVAGMHHWA
jgi:8-oxo-dGTP pyrophosphatase MutT (NUDIX family)